jgi:hypothetical protein
MQHILKLYQFPEVMLQLIRDPKEHEVIVHLDQATLKMALLAYGQLYRTYCGLRAAQGKLMKNKPSTSLFTSKQSASNLASQNGLFNTRQARIQSELVAVTKLLT